MDDKANNSREAPEEDIVKAEGSESGGEDKSSEDVSEEKPDASKEEGESK